jgi:hypothetical protein
VVRNGGTGALSGKTFARLCFNLSLGCERAAMKERRLPVVPTLIAVYRDLRRVLSSLRAIVIAAFLILLAISVAVDFVPQRLWDQTFSGEALSLLQNAGWALLLTPVVIAIHRFVVLGEVTPTYGLDVGERSFRLIFMWLLALKVFSGLPYTLLGALQTLGLFALATLVPFAAALIAVTAVSLRLTILIPAIAVAAPGARPTPAFHDTKGQTLRILAIFLLTLAPWVAAILASVILLGPRISLAGSVQAMIGHIAGGIVQTAILCLSAIIASHAFMFLAAKVKSAAAR